MKKYFSIIGGDQRNIKLAELLISDGHTIYTYGFENARLAENINKCNEIYSAIGKSEIIIGPTPFSNDEKNVNAPFHTGEISIDKVISAMTPNKVLIAGKISEVVLNLASTGDVVAIDLLERDDMSILNAIPTAEGAIQIAMEETDFTIYSSNCYVLGFGRVAKILADRLKSLGANVTCVARKNTDLAWIKALGYSAMHIKDLPDNIMYADIVFNTIPALVVGINILDQARTDSLFIDLASKPGGIDFKAADELGIRTIHALSIPGRVAPNSAANYIKDTIYNIIDEMKGS